MTAQKSKTVLTDIERWQKVYGSLFSFLDFFPFPFIVLLVSHEKLLLIAGSSQH